MCWGHQLQWLVSDGNHTALLLVLILWLLLLLLLLCECVFNRCVCRSKMSYVSEKGMPGCSSCIEQVTHSDSLKRTCLIVLLVDARFSKCPP